MKKLKALLLCIALCFTAGLTAVACRDDGEDTSSSTSSVADSSAPTSSDGFGEEESPVSVRFNQGQFNVLQHETVQLVTTVKGINEAKVFTSSDETVATVDANGVVTAKGVVGSATITLTVGNYSATCIVNVTKTPYVPEIVCDNREYTIEDGDVLKFTVATEWNKAPLNEDVAYKVSFAEDSLSAKAELAVNGNEVSVTSKGVEKINVVVSATVRGIYTSKSFSINIVEAKLKIKPTVDAFVPTSKGFKTSISTTAEIASDLENTLKLDFAVSKGSQTISDAEITWKKKGAAVKISDGQIVGQKRGTATLTGTVTVGSEKATVEVVCEVVPPEVHLDETTVLDVSKLSYYVVQSELLGELTDAEFNGVKVTTRVNSGNRLIFDNTLFPKKASLLGKQELVVNTELVKYTMDVEVYTMVIKTAQDLKDMKSHAKLEDTEWSLRFQAEKNSEFFDGYFVLGNDIAFNDVIESFTNTGAVWGVQGSELDYTRGFKGIFDGRGYTIDGLESCVNKYAEAQSGGIFGYLAPEGIVRNVTFTNTVLRENNGLICAYGDGLIENVVVSYKKIGGYTETSGIGTTGVRLMATFCSRGAGMNATIKNCIVDASMAEINYKTVTLDDGSEQNDLMLFGYTTKVSDSYVISSDSKVLSISGNAAKVTSFGELCAKTQIFEECDENVWEFVNGVPMLASEAKKAEEIESISFINPKDTLIAGFTMSVRLTSPYVEITASDVEGVEYKDGLLIATDEEIVEGQQVTLTATSLLDPGVTATHVVTINWLGPQVNVPAGEVKKVLHTNPVVEIGDNSWLGTENYAYIGDKLVGSGATELKIDLDKFGWNNWGEKDVTVVTVNGGEESRFNVTLNVVYDEDVMLTAETAAESFFKDVDSKWMKILKDESYVPTAEEKADGFASTMKYVGKDKATQGGGESEIWQNWPGKGVDLGANIHFNAVDLSDYKEVWFAVKPVNCNVQVYPGYTRITDNAWIYFHLTQTGESTWMIEMTNEEGNTLYKRAHQNGGATSSYGENTLSALFYNGWATATPYEDGFGLRFSCIESGEFMNPVIYVTEILGVRK